MTISKAKQLGSVPKSKGILCYTCGSEKYNKRLWILKKYIIDLKRNQIIEHKLRKELEKYGEVRSMRVRQDKHGRQGNIGTACLATEEQGKLAIKMLNFSFKNSEK